ncbi:TetR/AcrR family transcriptional regulator [Paenibacillus sp. LHD-117]|uniref:TetR/AcrR family transcriptional regulator n=1 Tax=Paenibacillus sp. LHD-117 TaxID=3071412 RepID=UPI0027DF8361|nr:TetR/AcrR family transcriptional regulator [Paenibacillus sp. LHD-117]MDQ6419383.1 TetR/AcrR family transcriptional regulator [Paenibacillus sp. LHD-117]
MRSNSKRALLLDAASRIVKEEGVGKLTLEAVAKEAGVSKGGLLHHFASKDDLIKGMVEEDTDRFVADVESRAEKDPAARGRWSRAYVSSTFDDVGETDGFKIALITALFAKPDLLGKLQDQYKIWQNQIQEDGIDPVNATIARLAADGLWFGELFGFGELDADLRGKVYARLLELTDAKEADA